MEVVEESGRDGPPTVAEGVGLLDAFTAAAHARHDAEVAVVETLGRLVRAGVIETVEALPIEVHLAVAHHYTTAERTMLLDAADVLAVMPATMTLWRTRVLSWSQVRALVGQVRRHGRDLRIAVDGRIGASADVVALLDADRFEWTVVDAIADLVGPDTTERDERAASQQSFLSVQPGLFGRSRIYGELDAVDTAIVLNGLDTRDARDTAAAAADAHDDADDGADGDPDDDAAAPAGGGGDSAGAARSEDGADGAASAGVPSGGGGAARGGGHGPAGWSRRTGRGRRVSRARRRARALVGLLADSLAGRDRDGTPRPARPLYIVHVPLGRITRSTAGLVEVAVPGWLPRLSARLTDTLAADADIKAVVFHGARPLHVTRKLTADRIPAATRLACAARDLGARDPAGRTPIPLSDLHHLSDDRTHDPDQMAYVSPRGHHRIIHRHGWTGRIDPDSGQLTWTHPTSGRTITTLPWSTGLRTETA